MGHAKQKERERKRSAATCQSLDKFFQAKRSKNFVARLQLPGTSQQLYDAELKALASLLAAST